MTLIIIILTSLVSIVSFSNPDTFNLLKFNAWLIVKKKQSWRFVSYALVHAGWMHLFINMFVLYSFGNNIEQSFKMLFGFPNWMINYAMLYVGGVLFATLFDFAQNKNNPHYDAVGASGAVAAVLFASILISPTSKLFIFPIPIPIPAYIFGVLYLIYSVYMGKQGKDNVGHFAHFFGAVFGIIFTLILKPGLAQRFIDQLFG